MQRIDEALGLVAEAHDRADRTGERWYQAELHRLRGELLLIQAPADEAEAERCFRSAIDDARSTKAKSLELRAVMSLARLLDKQGKRDDARAMLAEVYNWFTEGFDTPDLKDAKTLLDELEK
jgi:predicted ATPase